MLLDLFSEGNKIKVAADDDLFIIALKYLRSIRRIATQRWIAEKAGISQSSVSHIENGERKGRFETKQKIAAALGLKYKEMILLGLKIENEDAVLSPDLAIKNAKESKMSEAELWKDRFDQLEKRYNQLLDIILKPIPDNVELPNFPRGVGTRKK